MFKHTERRRLPYTPRQLFDLVADIEKYPQFVDWFVSARIRRRAANACDTDVVVRYGRLRVAFTTHTVFAPPRRIVVTTSDFPFRRFDHDWTFTPDGPAGTLVGYEVVVDLRFGVLGGLMNLLADQRQIAAATIGMFERRARQLYG